MLLGDVFNHWYINNLDRYNTLSYLIEYFKEYCDDFHLIQCLVKLRDTGSLSEGECVYVIRLVESMNFTLVELKTFASIFSGENLHNDYKTLDCILFKHKWLLSKSTNIFICWFFRLCNNNCYYRWAIHSFLINKLLMLLKTIGFVFIGIVISKLNKPLLHLIFVQSEGIVVTMLSYSLALFIVIIMLIILSVKYDVIGLLIPFLGFKRFCV